MKAVLLSIKPQYCELIARREKTIEVRKTKPKLKTPFKCYIYETKAINHQKILVDLDGNLPTIYAKGSGKVIGEFVCDRIEYLDMDSIGVGFMENGKFIYIDDLGWNVGLSLGEYVNYSEGRRVYGWHISNLIIYDKPKELSEFYVAYKKAKNECSLKEKTKEGTMCIATESICRGGCWKKSLIRPPQSWCYVDD